MADNKQPCAAWNCEATASYDKPLCYPHWLEWDARGLRECAQCHGFFNDHGFVLADVWNPGKGMELMCNTCGAYATNTPAATAYKNDNLPRSPIAHADITLTDRYVYILTLEDASFYVGQTTNLYIRMQEHSDGATEATRGKFPRLVYYETYLGGQFEVNDREQELTLRASDGVGQGRIRVMVEKFRENLRLLDLQA